MILVHRPRLELAYLVKVPVPETGLSTVPTSVHVAEQEWLEHSRTFLYLPPYGDATGPRTRKLQLEGLATLPVRP